MESVAHEEVARAAAAVFGHDAEVDEFDDVAAWEACEEQDAEGGISLAKDKPQSGIELASRLVSGEDVGDVAQPVEGWAVEALAVGAEDGTGEELVVFGGVGDEAAKGGQGGRRERATDGCLEVEQLGEGLEGTGQQDVIEGEVAMVEQHLGQMDAGGASLVADGFDQAARRSFFGEAVDVGRGEDEHGTAWGDDREDGADEAAVVVCDPGTAEIGVVFLGQIQKIGDLAFVGMAGGGAEDEADGRVQFCC